MKSQTATLATLLLVLFLFGCGQSGPLFIPGNPSTVQAPPAAQASAEEVDEDSEDPEVPEDEVIE